jgi:thioredoxin-related protein
MRIDRLARALLAVLLLAVVAAPASAESWEQFVSPFLGDLRSELAEAKASGRKGVVVMYHFDACPYCQRMKRDVLSRREVQDWYSREFVVLAIDTRGAQPITGTDGKVRPENEHARALGVKFTPTFDFLAVDGTRLYRHVGGLYEPAEFLLLGRYVADDAYRTQSFAEYVRSMPKKGN